MRKLIVIVTAMGLAFASTAVAQVSEIVIDIPSAGIYGLPEVPNLEEIPAGAVQQGAVLKVMPGDNVHIKLATTGEEEIPCKC